MTKQLKLSAFVAALLVSASAFAAKSGYAIDQSTESVIRNNCGECWRTNTFEKAKDGLVECSDREAVKPVVEVQSPVSVSEIEKITLSAKVLFDFDKASLRSDAKHALDPLVAKLKANAGRGHLKSVEISGYTDFLGHSAYNHRLSQDRADAVKAYFVAAGIPSDKITSVGRGSAQAHMIGGCKGRFPKYQKKFSRHHLAIKKCVESDRRVELTIEAIKESMVEQK